MRARSGFAWSRRRAVIACLLAQALLAGEAVAAVLSISAPPPRDATVRPLATPADTVSAALAGRSGSGRVRGIVLSAGGLALGAGLAVWLKAEADDRFDAYLHTADPERARAYRRDAQRFDRASLIGWGLAEVSFVALFYFLTRETERPLVPVRGEPIVRVDEAGVSVGLKVAP